MSGMKRCFCAWVPYWTIAGPTQARPMKHAPSGGALRLAISSLRTTCSMIPPPPPPTSFGHEKPTQRFARTFLFHSTTNLRSLRFAPSGRFSSRKARTSSRNASSCALSLKSISESSEPRDALVVEVGIAERRPRPLRALQVELDVVLGGVAHCAVELHAVDADPRERVGGVRLRERRRARELARALVRGPRGVVEERRRALHLDVHLGERVLHALVLADRRAELEAVLRVLDGDVERGLGGAEALGRDRDGPAVEQLLERGPGLAGRAEEGALRHPRVLEGERAHALGRVDRREPPGRHAGRARVDDGE